MVILVSPGARTRSRSENRSDAGAAALEFALVVPILLMMVFAIIEFGFAFAQTSALANGARQGARYGVVNLLATHTCGDIIAQVRSGATTMGMAEKDVAVKVQLNGAAPLSGCEVATGQATPTSTTTPCSDPSNGLNNTLNVTATYATHIEIPLAISKDVTLTGKGAYRCEYS